MANAPLQYIPNPLLPQDAEGKDLYLLTELNKIAVFLVNSTGNDEDFKGEGTRGYVPDPLTEGNLFLRDDGVWGAASGPQGPEGPPGPPGEDADPHYLTDHKDVTITKPFLNEVLTYDGVEWVNSIGKAGGDRNVDGGKSDSVYLPSQLVDGGGA